MITKILFHPPPPLFSFTGELCLGDSSKEIVAIKVLKETASREAEEDFMREVDIMSTFGHRNILSLKGVVLREGSSSPWMVFEYMPYGDLAEVLRSNSPQFGRSTKPGLQPLTQVKITIFFSSLSFLPDYTLQLYLFVSGISTLDNNPNCGWHDLPVRSKVRPSRPGVQKLSSWFGPRCQDSRFRNVAGCIHLRLLQGNWRFVFEWLVVASTDSLNRVSLFLFR